MKDLNRLKLLPILIVSLTLSKIIWKKFAHKKIYAETSLHWLGEGPKICPWRAANLAAMILWLETPYPYGTIHMNNVWDGGRWIKRQKCKGKMGTCKIWELLGTAHPVKILF